MIKSVSWPVVFKNQSGPYKLDNIKNALGVLNNPEKRIPFPIHVVGTNGKGSTIAFLESILKNAGFVSHVYTSPHLVCLNERIKLAGVQISDSNLLELLEQTRFTLSQYGLENSLSFFEGMTVASFASFAETKADFSLIEAGLGGRYDATNVIDSKICVLTSASYDHTEFLGDTLAEIVNEKLAIQGGAPFVMAHQPYEEVYSYFEGIENSIVYGKDFTIEHAETGFKYKSGKWCFEVPKVSLIGAHQNYNASTAIKVCEVLCYEYGFEISEDSIIKGIGSALWRARFEPIKTGKTSVNFSNLEVFLDGAHNENGIKTVLSELAKTNHNYVKTHIICGFLERKNLLAIVAHFREFREAFDELHTTSIHSFEKSRTGKELYDFFSYENLRPTSNHEFFHDALAEISDKEKSARVVILGSLYLAGEFLEWNNV